MCYDGVTSWLLWLLLFVSWFSQPSAGVYIFDGNPFQQFGELSIGTRTLNQVTDGVPVHSKVFYPSKPGNYTPIFFIPGLDGIVYPSTYSTALVSFAAYGYVVMSVDLYWPAVAAGENRSHKLKKTDAERSFELLQWMEAKLVNKVLPSQQIYNVTVDWSKLGLLSHSSGGDILVQMLQKNNSFAKAVAFLEPVGEHLKQPLDTPKPLPSLSYGTQLSMEFPECCIRGLGYRHFYQNLYCPKVLMDVKGYGHCDILDDVPGWDLCHSSNFCKTDKDNNRGLYRKVFVPGVLASFYGQYLQGNPNLINLIVGGDDLPLPLDELESDLDCPSTSK